MMKNYNLYYSSRVIGSIGDILQEIFIITIVASFSNSVLISGILVSLNAIVRIICSFFSIKVNVKYSFKRILFFLNLVYFFLTILFYFIIKLSINKCVLINIIILYEVLCSLVYTFYRIYQDALLKEITSDGEKLSRIYATDNFIKVVVSVLSVYILIYIDINYFLLLNAISFLISDFFIINIKILKNQESLKSNIENRNFRSGILYFYKNYRGIFYLILMNSILTFFYSSYSIVLQESISIFNLNIGKIGFITFIFNFFSIIFSYSVGFINKEKMYKFSLLILMLSCIFSIVLILTKGIVFFIIMILLYTIIGYGYNSLLQIYFQSKTLKSDIPILRGIYNIFCGTSIFLSGIIIPIVLKYFSIRFFWGLVFIILCVCIYIYIKLKGELYENRIR